MTVIFSSKVMEIRRRWHNIFSSTEREEQAILHLGKISFRSDREIKTFSDKGKRRELVGSKQILNEWLKESL